MVYRLDRAKRALVTLLKQLAAVYSAVLTLTRDSSDAAVRTAYGTWGSGGLGPGALVPLVPWALGP